MNTDRLVKMGKCFREEYDYERAYYCFLEAALDNDPEAILNLGYMYLNEEEPVRRDFGKAFNYLKKYYELTGKPKGGYEVILVHEDIEESEEGRAAYRDYIEFMISHEEWDYYVIKGNEFRDNGVYPKSDEEEMRCYRAAGKHGVKMGWECLAEKYYRGDGIKQDYKKAYDILQSYEGTASYKKNRILGEMFYYGRGVEKDIEKAVHILKEIVQSDNPWREMDYDYELARDLLGSIDDKEKDHGTVAIY